MGFFNKIFGYRWSLYITKNKKNLVYVMHANSVLSMVGYVMGKFANGSSPVPPWSLYLNFNKKNESFELLPEHFTPNGENITKTLKQKLELIDPNWLIGDEREQVFLEATTKKKLEISRKRNYFNLQEEIDDMNAPKDPTFFDIIRGVFGEDDSCGKNNL